MIPIVLEAAIRSVALGLAMWVALTLLRVRHPAIQKAAWTTVLIIALAMPVLMQIEVTPEIPGEATVLAFVSGVTVIAASGTVPWLAALYTAVALLMLARFGIALAKLHFLRHRATPVSAAWAGVLDVRVSEQLSSPASCGSTILLPADYRSWSDTTRCAVLAHESAHVRHRDCYVHWLAKLHRCLFWFNPLAWGLERKLSQLAEVMSDDAAAAALGDRDTYAAILLDFARKPAASSAAVPMARANLSTRIERLLSSPRYSAGVSRVVLLFAIVASLAVGAGAATLLHRPSPEGTPAPAATPGFNPVPLAGDQGVRILPKSMSESFYPAEAKRKGIEGAVLVRVKVDAAGKFMDARIVSEEPTGAGLGAAALQVARTNEYSNTSGGPAEIQYRVAFDLKN